MIHEPIPSGIVISSDTSSKVCSISRRMFALRFALMGNLWPEDSFRGPAGALLSSPQVSSAPPEWQIPRGKAGRSCARAWISRREQPL